MDKTSNPKDPADAQICLLDSDVIINWLSKESDPLTGQALWIAPHKIISLIEEKRLNGFSTVLNLLEIRFVLRRKKSFTEEKIQEDIEKILRIVEIAIPDEINMLEANNLQAKHPFSPLDAMLVAIGLGLKNIVLVTRDKVLLDLASKFLPAPTPEDFLQNLKIK